MDVNGDQEITPDEFAAAMGRTVDDRPGFDTAIRTAAHSLIQVADRDRNGVLMPGSIRSSRPCTGPAPSRQGGRSAGSTWTTMVFWTSLNSPSQSLSSSAAGTPPPPATSPSAAFKPKFPPGP